MLNNNEFADYMNTSNKIDTAIEEKKKEGDNVNVFVSSGSYKLDTKNDFVIMFYESLEVIIKEHKLSSNELLVLLALLKKASFGNLLSFSQKSLMNETKLTQSNVSKCLKKFVSCNLLIKTDDGEQYLNPQILCKGNLKKMQDSEKYKELKEKSKFNNF